MEKKQQYDTFWILVKEKRELIRAKCESNYPKLKEWAEKMLTIAFVLFCIWLTLWFTAYVAGGG